MKKQAHQWETGPDIGAASGTPAYSILCFIALHMYRHCFVLPFLSTFLSALDNNASSLSFFRFFFFYMTFIGFTQVHSQHLRNFRSFIGCGLK